jgi:dihydrolipoamide dehydrogenase
MIFKRKHYDFDLIVIGSGAGGSVGAHYARSLGKKVAVFEKGAIGGECPNFACVPTKALLYAAGVLETIKNSKAFGIETKDVSVNHQLLHEWKNLVVSRTGSIHGEEAFQKDGIHLIREEARFVSAHEVEAGGKIYSGNKFLLATGSNTYIPSVTGLSETGYITFKEAVDLKKFPKSLLIFGGGAIGCEFAQIFASFGTKVTLVNRSERILSKEDSEVSELATALFENAGIIVLSNTSLVKAEKKGTRKVVHMQKGNKEFFEQIDEILVATGKVPVLDFMPEKAGIKVENSHLHTNHYLQTNVPHIYAAGDLVGPYLFTHSAEYQGYLAVHNAFSYEKTRADYSAIARCVFISPEVAAVGLTEREAREKGIRIKKGIAPIAVVGRANTSNEFDGFVKVITDKKGVIIGASIFAPHAGEMIHELSLAIKLRVKASYIAEMIHAYPTYSEAIKIACNSIK